MIGRRAGGGLRPGACGTVSSIVTLDISAKSSSRRFFTSLAERDAAGLNGPGLVSSGRRFVDICSCGGRQKVRGSVAGVEEW